MLRKIVFINQATGYLTIDIINEFAKEFDKVELITGSIRVQDVQLDREVKIKRIVKYNRGNIFKKALSWFIGTLQILFLLKTRYRRFEVFYFTIPPTAYLNALSVKSVFSIAIFDLYPEALKANGFTENSFFYRWWSRKNRQIFPKAFRLYTLSESLKKQVLEYSSSANVSVVSNWSAFSGFTPIEKHQNSIVKRENLDDKFIIQYSGNIGVTHNVETLIEVAELLKDHTGLLFQIIGRGERSKAIGEMINSKQLRNCSLQPFRKDEELYESLCSADLAVIILDDKTADISVPSKTYNIMAAGVPIMAITSLKSGLSEIISQFEAGESFEKGNVKGVCDFILELKSNPDFHKRLSGNSKKASESFSTANAAMYLEIYNG